MSIPATLFKAPNGQQEIIEIMKVRPEDEAYIETHDIKLSLEELSTGDIVIYFDYGATLEDGTPNEWLEFAKGRSCEDTIAAGVEEVKRSKTEG